MQHFQIQYNPFLAHIEFAYRGISKEYVIKYLSQQTSVCQVNIEHRRDGFETSNANKIFESTYIGAEQSSHSDSKDSYQQSCNDIDDFLNQISSY